MLSLIHVFRCCTFVVTSKDSFPNSVSRSFPPVFLSELRNFRSDHFELISARVEGTFPGKRLSGVRGPAR